MTSCGAMSLEMMERFLKSTTSNYALAIRLLA